MDSDSILIQPLSSIACGAIIFAIFFVLTFIPNNSISFKVINTIQKGQRPYKSEIIRINFPEADRNNKSSRNELLYHAIITSAAEKYNVDPALIKAVIMAESGYDPTAISKKGAVGLMQLMPATAYSLGVKDLFDPAHNVNGGVKYLKGLLNKYKGNLKLALAAYNAGITNVRKYQGIPPYKTTHNYIKRVFEYYQHYQGGNKV